MTFEFLKAALLGLVEGITEWIPISSTGHLILLNEFLNLSVSTDPVHNEAFMEMFNVVIQLGAIFAVVVLFWHKLWPFGRKNNPKPLRQEGLGAYVKADIFSLWGKIIVTCIPAVFVGLFLDDWIEEHFYTPWMVAAALIVFGVAFIVIERWNKGTEPKICSVEALDYKLALWIGLFQVLAAIFPGTSRSGATIVGALLLGVSRTAAAEYTFCLAVPVMFGASFLKLFKFGLAFSGMELGILFLSMAVAFAVSLVVIRFLMSYVRKHDFQAFGWYRIVLGVAVLLYFGLWK